MAKRRAFRAGVRENPEVGLLRSLGLWDPGQQQGEGCSRGAWVQLVRPAARPEAQRLSLHSLAQNRRQGSGKTVCVKLQSTESRPPVLCRAEIMKHPEWVRDKRELSPRRPGGDPTWERWPDLGGRAAKGEAWLPPWAGTWTGLLSGGKGRTPQSAGRVKPWAQTPPCGRWAWGN